MYLNLKSIWTFLIAAGLISYTACRKTDQTTVPQNNIPKNSAIEDRFFNSNRTSDPTEKALVDFIKSKNNEEHFVEQTVKQIGYPRWDKIVTTASKSKIAGRGNSDSSLATYYLPFVRDSQNYVNASMVIKTYPSDTTFSYKCDWQYSQIQNNTNSVSDSSEYLAIFFMVLDKHVFGYTKFNITDTTIFKHTAQKPLYVKLDSTTVSGRNSLLMPIEVCQDVTIYFIDCTYPGHPDCTPTCDGCWECTSHISYQYCWTDYIDDGSGGGGTGGGTGGGGTGGGSSTPPNNGCGGIPVARGTVQEGCEPGWTPGGGGNTNPLPLPPYVLNNLTKPCLKAALNKLSGGTRNTFFKQIYNIFDTSTVNHLEINEGDLTSDTAYGLAYPPLVLPQGLGVSFQIKMDTVKLLNCSQEWMAYVMIHEVAHAALFANVIQWDTTNSQHDAMISQYLTQMATSLTSAYPGLSAYDAYSICYTGFNNGIDGNGASAALLYIMLKKVKQKLNNPSINAQQLISRGEEYAETGTKGLRTGCN